MMLWLDRLELNNKTWFRKLVRVLGGNLVPNFEVEELVLVCMDANSIDSIYVIGDSMGEYECVDVLSGEVSFRNKYEIDEDYKVVSVLYKGLSYCPITCEARVRQMDKVRTVKVSFDVVDTEENDLVIDVFKQEVEQCLKGAYVEAWRSGKGLCEVRVAYLKEDEAKYSRIKDKYDRKLQA